MVGKWGEGVEGKLQNAKCKMGVGNGVFWLTTRELGLICGGAVDCMAEDGEMGQWDSGELLFSRQ